MAELKDEEERLRVLLKKIDAEILRFNELLEKAKAKREEVEDTITGAGLHKIPVNVKPSSEALPDLVSELNQHLLNLNKIKNFISGKLEAVVKEEELIEQLKSNFGEKIKIKKQGSADFEVDFSDEETKRMYEKLLKSKKEMESVKALVHEMEKK